MKWLPEALIFLAATMAARSQIQDHKTLEIDFTKPGYEEKVSWSEADSSVTSGGLGWNGKSTSSPDVWFLTEPMALGLHWRPASMVSVVAKISSGMGSKDAQPDPSMAPWFGSVYVRYGPDRKHWTDWQVLQVLQVDENLLRKKDQVLFTSTLRIPNRDREDYEKLLREFQRKANVSWGSDEGAAVRWIVAEDPTFFEKRVPFMGYLQFLYESRLQKTRRVASFSVDVEYALGGRAILPREDVLSQFNERRPWDYRAPDAEENPDKKSKAE
jgi:hypothetical protein